MGSLTLVPSTAENVSVSTVRHNIEQVGSDILTGYCGNSLDAGSVPAPLAECNMLCAGDPYEYCGAGNRLELYRLANATSTPGPTSKGETV